MDSHNEPFELMSVVHLVRPTGRRAHNLEELRAGIAECSATTLFLHSHEHQLRVPAGDELHPGDLTAWVNGVVQDRETAERLSFATQHRGSSAAELRTALLEVLESVPEKTRITRDAPEEGDFLFLDMESVAVSTGRLASDCAELMQHLADTNPSVLFYHLVEQPWLMPDAPSLSGWARACGDGRLAEWLEECLYAGRPLEETRRRLLRRWRQRQLGRRITDASRAPESARREEARRAVAGLVRRMTRPGETDDAGSGS